jgi:hypothetical protein
MSPVTSLSFTAPGNRRAGFERVAWPAGAVAASIALGVAAGLHPVLALVALILVAGTCLVVARPFYGVMALAVLTPVTSAMKSGLLIPHLRPSQALIIWLAPLVILCARRPVRGWSLLEWLGLAYALGTLLLGSFDLWRQSFPFSSSNIDALLGPFQYLLLLRATRVGVRTERELCLVVRALLLTAVPVCALALMQGFGITWAQNLAHTVTGVDEGHLDRAIGLFTNWQVLAGYLISVGLIAVAVAAYGARSILPTRRATWLAVIIGLSLARTLTIGAFVGWLIASGALLMMSGHVVLTAKRVSILCGAGVAAVALVLAARYHQEFTPEPGHASNGIIPNTVMDRIHNWTRQYLPALAGRWVTGFGPGIPSNVTWQFTDSVYVTIVLRGGLVLLGIYATLMAGFVSIARPVTRGSRPATALAAALLTLVIVLIPLQLLATYFTTSGLPEVIWILAGLVSISAVAAPNGTRI